MNKKCFLYVGILVSMFCGTNLFSIPKLDTYHLGVVCYYGNLDINDLKSLTFVSKHVKEGIATLHINPKALDSIIVENPEMLTRYLEYFNIIIPNLQTIRLDSEASFSENFVRQVRKNFGDDVIFEVPERRENVLWVDDKEVKFSLNRALVDLSTSAASGIVCCFGQSGSCSVVEVNDASIVEELLRPRGCIMDHFNPKSPEGKVLSIEEVLRNWPELGKFNDLKYFGENLLDKINQEIDLRNKQLENKLLALFELNMQCFTYRFDVNANKKVCVFDIAPVQKNRALKGKKPFVRVGKCLVDKVSNLELRGVKCLHGNGVFLDCTIGVIFCPDLVMIEKDVFWRVRKLNVVIMPQLTKIVKVGNLWRMYRWCFCMIVGTAEGFDTVINELNECGSVIHKDFKTDEVVEEYKDKWYTSGYFRERRSLDQMKVFCRKREQDRQQELVDILRLTELSEMLESWK